MTERDYLKQIYPDLTHRPGLRAVDVVNFAKIILADPVALDLLRREAKHYPDIVDFDEVATIIHERKQYCLRYLECLGIHNLWKSYLGVGFILANAVLNGKVKSVDSKEALDYISRFDNFRPVNLE